MEPSTARIVALALIVKSVAAVQAAAAPQQPLNEGQILLILMFQNAVEAEAARIGQQRARSPAVRDFARKALQEREEADRRFQAYRMYPPMADFAKSTREGLTRLAAVPQDAFDAVYLRDQEAACRVALADLDALIIPNATGPEASKEAKRARELAERELKEATRLLARASRH